MATEVWCELVCARCARTCYGRHTYNGRVPRKELKAEARSEGWTFNRLDEAHCKACTEAIAREECGNG
ncbi:hypothetical protein ACSMEB_17230 [Stenotrophomonas maltophilia]|uniref:hypothetical protein n=1 Tax=Stenotrophomonas TaxID=40323 RepID=UPI001312C420|nr:hypothetical protein [Stenotrophomonas maltophilia]HDS1216259.1 hypothetical protein [Stenotrophomonas maltophilia]